MGPGDFHLSCTRKPFSPDTRERTAKLNWRKKSPFSKKKKDTCARGLKSDDGATATKAFRESEFVFF